MSHQTLLTIYDDFLVHHISLEIYTAQGYQLYEKGITPFSYHTHEYLSIILVDTLSGFCEYIIDGKSYQVETGSLLIINPHVEHCKKIEENTSVQEIHICAQNFSRGGAPKSCFVEEGSHLHLRLSPHDRALFHTIASTTFSTHLQDQTSHYQLFQQGIFLQISALIAHIQDFPTVLPVALDTASNSTLPLAQSLHFYISTHYMEHISIQDFAVKNFISQEYLTRSFKKKYGKSPHAYQIEQRLEEACRLLQETTEPIQTIAEWVGYNDSTYFNRLFKKYIGTTPNLFRKSSDS